MNIRKRFFSFLMAFAMLVSCMTVAQATEVEETTDIAVVDNAGSTIMPRAWVNLGDMVSGVSNSSQPASGLFQLLGDGNVVALRMTTNTNIYLTLFSLTDNATVCRMTLNNTNGQVGMFQLPTTIRAGNYRWTMSFQESGKAYAGQFMVMR